MQYERRMERANHLYKELNQCMQQLKSREKELTRSVYNRVVAWQPCWMSGTIQFLSSGKWNPFSRKNVSLFLLSNMVAMETLYAVKVIVGLRRLAHKSNAGFYQLKVGKVQLMFWALVVCQRRERTRERKSESESESEREREREREGGRGRGRGRGRESSFAVSPFNLKVYLPSAPPHPPTSNESPAELRR